MSEKNFSNGIFGNTVAVGIDQSLTGFAFTVIDVTEPTHFATWVYKSPFNGVQRLVDIQRFLFEKCELLKDCAIIDIAMESPFLGSPSTLPLSELAATVKLFLYHYFEGQDYRAPLVIPPLTLKKYATGKGTAKKQEMLLQIYKRWGVEFTDDNAADSYALARLAAGISIDSVEMSVIDKIKDLKYRDSIR